jgi:hypothetical protein
MIEARGIATTTIGLVRPHLERTRPPRGLWVPFPLGRPLGEPEDNAFQHSVLKAALSLLERTSGPVILEDYPSDAPSMTDSAGWQPELSLETMNSHALKTGSDWATAFEAEMHIVMQAWEVAKNQSGRTMVGNARLSPTDWVPYAMQFIDGNIPESPVAGISSAVLLRYIADDIKAMYYEAAQAPTPRPSVKQIEFWFWNNTLAADFLRTLRRAALESSHKGFNVACSRFVVPMPYVERNG